MTSKTGLSLDDRGLAALTETLRDLDDFDQPWPYPETHAAAILGDRAVFWPTGTEEYREAIRQYQAEVKRLRDALARLYEYTGQVSHVCVDDGPLWRERCPVGAARIVLEDLDRWGTGD